MNNLFRCTLEQIYKDRIFLLQVRAAGKIVWIKRRSDFNSPLSLPLFLCRPLAPTPQMYLPLFLRRNRSGSENDADKVDVKRNAATATLRVVVNELRREPLLLPLLLLIRNNYYYIKIII